MMAAPHRRARGGAEAEKRLAEKDQLTAAYNRGRRERIQALCDGPQGEHVKELIRFLKRMDLKSGRELIRRAETAQWVIDLSDEDTALLLSIVSGGIRLMRERNGLTPFDDPLWDEPPNVFQQIKATWGVR